MPGTRKLGRATDHRKSMLRGLVTYLLEKGSIETTVTRAKEVRAVTEKMITAAKADNLSAWRRALAFITKEDVVKKLFDEIAPKYRDVPGGYTRIVRTAARRGDAAEMCIIELVESPEEKAAQTAKSKSSRGSRKAADSKKTEKPAAKKAAPAEEVKTEAPAEAETVEEAAVEAPAEEAPVEEAAVEEAPVEEVLVEEAPAEEAPAEEAPVEAVEEAPVEEAPVEETAAEEAVAEEAPAEEAPAEETPAE